MTQFYLSLWLNRTLVCIYYISFIHSSANGYTVWLQMWLLWTVLQTTLCVSISWGPSHWSLSGTYLQVVYIAGHMNFHTDFHSGQQFTFLQQCVWVPFPTSSQACVTASPWRLRILNTFSGICWWYVLHLRPVGSLPHLLIGLFGFWFFKCIVDINPPSDAQPEEFLLLLRRVSWLDCLLCCGELFNLMQFPLSTVGIMSWTTGSSLKTLACPPSVLLCGPLTVSQGQALQ